MAACKEIPGDKLVNWLVAQDWAASYLSSFIDIVPVYGKSFCVKNIRRVSPHRALVPMCKCTLVIVVSRTWLAN